MQNLEQTILSQYANSPTLLSWITSINSALDPTEIINSFYLNVWNINTANGYGLDVWGRIVGVDRTVIIAGGENFGFSEASSAPFNTASFYSGEPATDSYALSDTAFRLLILAKALSNISNSSSFTYNKILMQLFPSRGNAYIQQVYTMQSILVFEFDLEPFEISVLQQSGALSPPTGVQFSIMSIDIESTFGFAQAGSSAAPFNCGTFFQGFQ